MGISRTVLGDRPEKRTLKFWCPLHGISTADHIRASTWSWSMGIYLLKGPILSVGPTSCYVRPRIFCCSMTPPISHDYPLDNRLAQRFMDWVKNHSAALPVYYSRKQWGLFLALKVKSSWLLQRRHKMGLSSPLGGWRVVVVGVGGVCAPVSVGAEDLISRC